MGKILVWGPKIQRGDPYEKGIFRGLRLLGGCHPLPSTLVQVSWHPFRDRSGPSVLSLDARINVSGTSKVLPSIDLRTLLKSWRSHKGQRERFQTLLGPICAQLARS